MNYNTEGATLPCVVCQGTAQMVGKGLEAWKINGRPVLTAEGLEGAAVLGCRPPVAGGLGCGEIKRRGRSQSQE